MLEPESRFTPASEWCPKPEYWHSADNDSTEIEVTELVGAFVKATQPEIVVETGSAWGQTAYEIGSALLDNGHGHLYSLEVDPGRVEHCRKLCEGFPVTIVQQASLEFEPPGPVGFAWFDSLIHLRTAEFIKYRPHIIPGSIVGFHDAGPIHGLWPQVESLEAQGLMKTIRMRTPRGVVFAQVL